MSGLAYPPASAFVLPIRSCSIVGKFSKFPYQAYSQILISCLLVITLNSSLGMCWWVLYPGPLNLPEVSDEF